METDPKHRDGKEWEQLEDLIQMEIAGNSNPLFDYISQHDSDENWRESAMQYLIGTSGDILDETTSRKLWTIGGDLTLLHPTKQASTLTTFVELKWNEFARLKPALLSDKQKSCATLSIFALFMILSNLRTAEAVKMLEELVEICKGNYFEDAAKTSLAKAKKVMAL